MKKEGSDLKIMEEMERKKVAGQVYSLRLGH